MGARAPSVNSIAAKGTSNNSNKMFREDKIVEEVFEEEAGQAQ